MRFFKKLNDKADDQSDQGDDFVLVDDDETPDSETCTWEECIACIKVRFVFKLKKIINLIIESPRINVKHETPNPPGHPGPVQAARVAGVVNE